MFWMSTLDPFVRVTSRRAVVLGSSALVGGCLVLATPQMARAACEIDGVAVAPGVPVAPATGQTAACVGEGLVDPVVAEEGSADVTVTIGDGATTTVLDTGEETAITIRDDSTVTIHTNATVSTSGDEADAIYTGDDNTVTVNGGTVSTTGYSADAIYASGDSTTVTINGGTVSTSGDDADAVLTYGDNTTVTINGGTVSTTGDDAEAVFTIGDNTTVTIHGGTVSTSGDTADAVFTSGDSTTVIISGGTVSATGAGSAAVRMKLAVGETGSLTLGTEATVIGDLVVEEPFTGAGAGTGELTLNGQGAGMFDDDIVGFTSLAKTEAGTWTLNGDILNSGGIAIQAGTLAFNGTTDSNVTVQDGAALAGSGTMGDIDFEQGSAYRFDVGSDGFLDSSGEITINDDVAADLVTGGPLGIPLGSPVTVLSADGGVTGIFDTVNEDFVFLDGALSSDANNVFLTLDRNAVAFADVAETPNQKAVASGADSLNLDSAVLTALAVQDAAGAREAFDQLSGEVHASTLSGLAQDAGTLRGIVNTRARGGQGGAALGQRAQAAQSASLAAAGTAAPATDKRSEAWVQPYGSFGRLEGDGNAAELTRTSGGLLLGLESEVAYELRAGVFLGYSHGWLEADDRASEAQSDSYTLGAYGSRQFGPLRTQAGASFTWHRIDSERAVAFGGLDEDLSADYDARTYQVFAEVGYSFETAVVDLEPFAGLAGIYQEADGFSEEGGAAALDVEDGDQLLGVSTLGLRASRDFTLSPGAGALTVDGVLGWRHSFGDLAPETTARFGEGSDAFTVAGTPIDEDTLLVETGVSYDLSQDITLSLGYRGELGRNAQDNAVNAKISLRF